MSFPAFHHLFLFSQFSNQLKTLFSTSQTYMSHPFPFAFFCAATVSALASTRSFFIFWTLQNHSTLELICWQYTNTNCHSRYVNASKCWKSFVTFLMSSCRWTAGKEALIFLTVLIKIMEIIKYLNFKMELNTYKTKLVSNSKAVKSGTGTLLSGFCQRLSKW